MNTPGHILIKMTKIKDKDKILKATRNMTNDIQEDYHQALS